MVCPEEGGPKARASASERSYSVEDHDKRGIVKTSYRRLLVEHRIVGIFAPHPLLLHPCEPQQTRKGEKGQFSSCIGRLRSFKSHLTLVSCVFVG